MSFRVDTPEQRKHILSWFGDLVKARGELARKGEALLYLMDQYDLNFKNLRFQDVPDNIEHLIQQADCQYLKYEPFKEGKEERVQFVCYEFFSRKKKPSPLGTDHKLILNKCYLCKAGKIDRIETDVQKQLRKKNIKGLLSLRDILINLQIEGGLAQIYICKAKLLDKKQLVVSTDGTHLPCPLEPDNLEVLVKKHCYHQITPWTMEPPCQYLIDPFIMVKIEPPEEAQEIIKEIAQDYTEETPDPELKNVDAEVLEPKEGEEEQ